MKIEAKEYFDQILNTKYGRNICRVCGRTQTHNLRWCKNCGAEFVAMVDITIYEAMKIAKNISFENGSNARDKRPEFISAMWQSRIRARGFSEIDFTNYVKNLLGSPPEGEKE